MKVGDCVSIGNEKGTIADIIGDRAKVAWSPWTFSWEDLSKLERGHQFSLCDHEYVDVGFQFTKMVCKKCDEEKK